VWVHRKASRPVVLHDQPTAAEPSAETAIGVELKIPPGRSPRPTKVIPLAVLGMPRSTVTPTSRQNILLRDSMTRHRVTAACQ
jgi:hypothetical protein